MAGARGTCLWRDVGSSQGVFRQGPLPIEGKGSRRERPGGDSCPDAVEDETPHVVESDALGDGCTPPRPKSLGDEGFAGALSLLPLMCAGEHEHREQVDRGHECHHSQDEIRPGHSGI